MSAKLLGLDGLSEWLSVSEATARRMVNQPGFPEPVTPGFQRGKNAIKRWFADEVEEWLRSHRKAA